MYELAVINFCGNAVTDVRSVQIDPQREISIGRSQECDLVLQDSHRHVSRVQVRIACDREGRLVLANCSTVNSVFVNDREIQPSQHVVLSEASRLMIGLYGLEVRRVPTVEPAMAPVPQDRMGAVSDTWSALLEGIGPPPPAPIPASLPLGIASTTPALPHDVFAPLGMAPATMFSHADPLQLGGSPASVDLQSMLESSIPSDRALGWSQAPHAVDMLPEAGVGQGPLGSIFPRPNETLDVLASLSTEPRGLDRPPAAMATSAGELDAMFDLPTLSGAGNGLDLAPGLLLDNLPQTSNGRHPTAESVPVPAPVPSLEADREEGRVSQAPAAAGDLADLQAALFEGANISGSPSAALDAECMRRLGRIVRSVTDGLLHLALVQKEMSREMNAGAASPATDNNIFYSISNSEAIVHHLLDRPFPGFTQREAAIGAMLVNLQAHEIALLTAVRSSIAELVDRLRPEIIAKKNQATRGLLATVMPVKEKARLWDAYVADFEAALGLDQEDIGAKAASMLGRHYSRERENLTLTQTIASGLP